jgi:hypothetical protein
MHERVRAQIERAAATVVVGGDPAMISADDALPQDVDEVVREWLSWWGTPGDLIVHRVEGGARIERPTSATKLNEPPHVRAHARWRMRAVKLATSRWLWMP